MVCGVADPYCGMKAYNLKANKQNYFSRYNSVGTALTLDYIAKKLSFKNVDIKITPRNGQSKFGGTLFVRVKVVIFIVYWVEKIIFNLGVTKFFQFNKKSSFTK